MHLVGFLVKLLDCIDAFFALVNAHAHIYVSGKELILFEQTPSNFMVEPPNKFFFFFKLEIKMLGYIYTYLLANHAWNIAQYVRSALSFSLVISSYTKAS